MREFKILTENNIITNIFVIDENGIEFAKSLDAKPYYEGAKIGEIYSPPSIEKDLLDAVIEQGIKIKKLEMGLNNNVV